MTVRRGSLNIDRGGYNSEEGITVRIIERRE